MKKILAITAAATVLGGVGVSAAQADAQGAVDSASYIASTAPVPGAFTAGRWNVVNTGNSGVIPAGTTYVVQFSSLSGVKGGTGLTTVTSYAGSTSQLIGGNEYRITLTSDLQPGQGISGLWSEAQNWFGNRNVVSLSLEKLPSGVIDSNSSNNVATYTNGGRGF